MQKLLLMLVFVVSFAVASDNDIKREVKFIRSAQIFIDQDDNENVVIENCYYDMIFTFQCQHNRALNQYFTYDDNEPSDIPANIYEFKKKAAQLFLQQRN
ncbi:MAG: hypothetical protein Q8Q60_04755 [Candidatus Chromulinivorax sp.]|nr:hypothetical protein [Candidatus Chromulinivorax sp.]